MSYWVNTKFELDLKIPKTDFPLKGIHEKTVCTACHKADKKYNEAPVACIDCHKKSDVHDGRQGKKCGSCHTAADWKKTAFNMKPQTGLLKY